MGWFCCGFFRDREPRPTYYQPPATRTSFYTSQPPLPISNPSFGTAHGIAGALSRVQSPLLTAQPTFPEPAVLPPSQTHQLPLSSAIVSGRVSSVSSPERSSTALIPPSPPSLPAPTPAPQLYSSLRPSLPTPTPASQLSSSFPLSLAPKCIKCGGIGVRYITKNARNRGRPYYKCRCSHWICFDDMIGINDENPVCGCGKRCRREISGPEKGERPFDTCQRGQCGFWQEY